MTIRFIPNDPLVLADLPERRKTARPDPPNGRAAFTHTPPAPEAVYAVGTPEFLFWQCRESAIAALDAWALASVPLATWQGKRVQLPLRHCAGAGLNAEYDRKSLSFFEWSSPDRCIQTGASTDAVAHEVGHAILDAIRPELWESTYVEPAAFHEAFADCIALLVGLFDRATRQALLAGRQPLRGANFLETLAEQVADGVHQAVGDRHPQSAPRHAYNDFQWRLPTELPRGSNSPTILTTEPHSFGRVFTGCFYDTILEIFAEQPDQDERGLHQAARIAGRLLAVAVANAPEARRFFQAIGRTMILADAVESGGAHHLAIKRAFARHNVALGSSAMLAPVASLGGDAPRLDPHGTRMALPATTRRRLMTRIGAQSGSRLSVTSARLGREVVAHAASRRDVALRSIPGLPGVIARAAECLIVGSSHNRAVVLGELPDTFETHAETELFVDTLLENDDVRLPTTKRRRTGETRKPGLPGSHTHAVRKQGARKLLKRVRFSCRANADSVLC